VEAPLDPVEVTTERRHVRLGRGQGKTPRGASRRIEPNPRLVEHVAVPPANHGRSRGQGGGRSVTRPASRFREQDVRGERVSPASEVLLEVLQVIHDLAGDRERVREDVQPA
jgi:hypothetical protein